jgi:hypothetical protein
MTSDQSQVNEAAIPPKESHTVSLWAGVVAPPILWMFQFQLLYMIVPWVCRNHHTWLMHFISLLFVLIVLGCAGLCWLEYSRLNALGEDTEAAGAAGRTHFLSLLGTWLALLTATLIFAQGVVGFFINPCWD